MRGKPASIQGALAASALFAALAAQPAHAQALNGWSLPAPDASSTGPSAQGPVDAQNPVVRPAAPETAAPAAPASPVPVPVITPPAGRAASQPAPDPSPARPAAAAPVALSSATPEQAPNIEPAPAPAVAPVRPSATPEPLPVTDPAPTPPSTAWRAWWWLVPAALAVLTGGFLLLRRKPGKHGAAAAEESAAPAADVLPHPATPAPPPALAPAPTQPRASGDLMFEPIAMRLSLVYATLQFRLVLTTRTDIPPGKLLAALISAHAALPQDQQLAPRPETLGLVQAFPRLTPGEVLELEGEVQVPLAAVRPVRQGSAAFMVPLLQLALLGDEAPALPRLELGFVFTVGLSGPGPALAPVRLDTGPRQITGLAAREIEVARRTALLGLDPARATG